MRIMELEQLAHLLHLFVPGNAHCQKMASSQRLLQVYMAKIPIHQGEKTGERLCETTLPLVTPFDSFHKIPARHDVNVAGIVASRSQRVKGLHYVLKLVNHT